MNGNGSQKTARLERLKMEIIEYISSNPGCSAADIVDHLSNTRRMRNHGLTSRKVGFFIPRYLKNNVMFTLDRSTGKRIYSVA
jgi:predicted DNA-binding ribbon-helix-helix protein